MSFAPPKRTSASLAVKLGVLILVSTACIFAAAFGYNYRVSRQYAIENVHQEVRLLAEGAVFRIESVLDNIETLVASLTGLLERNEFSQTDLEMLIRDVLDANPSIFGSAIAFEPNQFDPQQTYFAPYGYRKDGGVAMMYLGGDNHRYHAHDWYLIPKTLGRPVWTEPYYDEGGGRVTMATYSSPFYRTVNGVRTFAGIVTADIALDWLVDIVDSIKFLKTGYGFIVSHNGVFVSHPNEAFVMRESVFSLAEDSMDADLRRIGQDMVKGGRGLVPTRGQLTGKPSWLYYAPLPSAAWSVGIIFPIDELFADLRSMEQVIISIGVAGFALLALVIAGISTHITRPLRVLSRRTAEIAKGNLDVEVPTVPTNDEVGVLSQSFENMRVALKEYIQTLTQTTAAKERIESELKIAHSIQMSFLPRKFPAFQDRDDFSLHAHLEPAKEVGGDLYDFFLLTQNHLFISIGDVSDKGVPAALFMAVTKTLMKGIAEHGLEPSEILRRVNTELCPENESMMFVTLFCGILDLSTGDLRYSNAGHTPPLWMRADGSVERIPLPQGVPLGVFPDAVYESRTMRLEPGGLLLGYTDGVTEAMNPAQALFTEQRLIQCAAACTVLQPETVIEQLLASVQSFVQNAPQSDDITLLAVRFNGPSGLEF